MGKKFIRASCPICQKKFRVVERSHEKSMPTCPKCHVEVVRFGPVEQVIHS